MICPNRNRVLLLSLLLALCGLATSNGSAVSAASESGALWMQTAAEYQALTRSAFYNASRVLPRAVRDPRWSAALEQKGFAGRLPPAMVLDIGETSLDNSAFQGSVVKAVEQGAEEKYYPAAWDAWVALAQAPAVPGAPELVATAQALGVEVFYVTNRECKERAAGGPRCPQEADTRRNLVAAGFPPTDAAHLLLKGEVDAWTSEKSNRRALIAQTHRIVMLVGDDLGDFLSTARDMPLDERAAWVDLAEDWWGTRWIIVPNPIYGSWLKQLGEQPLDHLVALDAIVDAIHQERACAQASGGTGVGSPKAPAAPAAPAAAHAKAASDKIRVATWNLNNLQ